MTVPAVPTLRQQAAVILGCLLLLLTVACAPLQSIVPKSVAPAARPPVPAAGNVPSAPAVQQAADVPPGKILYVRDGNLWLWQNGMSRQFSQGNTWYQPSFSPDGKQVAYVYWT